MSKYAFFCLPASGHLNPTLAVARELVARGEEVIYVLPESFRATVEATGASFRGYELLALEHLSSTLQPQNDPVTNFIQSLVLWSRQILPQIMSWLEIDPPDYIMCENLCLWARIVIRSLHIPAICFYPSYIIHEQPSMNGLYLQFETRLHQSFRMVGAELQAVCNEYGVQMREPHELFTAVEPLNVAFFPRFFQPGGEHFDDRFVFVGPSIAPWRQTIDFPLHHLDQRPLLSISLGTSFNDQADFFKLCITALKDLPWQIVLSYGSRVDRTAFGSLPENVLAAPSVPQLEILKRATIFITHGGMNSVMESLYYGVPMVVVPQMLEQTVSANRVQECGLGVALAPEQISKSHLYDAVIHVAQDSVYQNNMQEAQRKTRDAGGFARAVDAIMQFKTDLEQ